jgi:outer membrane receptor protein involved in Fe transport
MGTCRLARDASASLPATFVLCISLATGALAQQPAPSKEGIEEIVVTGSRIARRDYSAQSPLVSIGADTFEQRASIGLEAALNQLPQFHAAGTQASTSSAATYGPGATAAPGAATLDLRSLGVNRNLVLIDGKRAQPINGALAVDINTIPSAAVDRVEVITGAAAAVYGADAIAGVTNFILKKNFEGARIDFQSGISEEGDGNESSLNLLLGASFADGRGNVMLGANYSKREIILGKNRRWVVAGWDDPGTAGGSTMFSNLSQMSVTPGNAPTVFPLKPGGIAYSIDQNGHVFDVRNPLDPAHPYTGPLGGTSGFKIDATDGSLRYDDREHRYLQLPLERYAVFGSGHIELTDRIQVFTDLRFAETHVQSFDMVPALLLGWSPLVQYDPANDDPGSPTFGTAKPRHPVPRDLADLLNSRPFPHAPWTYAGGLDYLPNIETDTTSNVYQVIGGLRGDATVGRNEWSWEVYLSHGKTTVNAHQPAGFTYLPRLQNLFDADQFGEGFDVLDLPGAVPVAVTATARRACRSSTRTAASTTRPPCRRTAPTG